MTIEQSPVILIDDELHALGDMLEDGSFALKLKKSSGQNSVEKKTLLRLFYLSKKTKMIVKKIQMKELFQNGHP